MKMWVNLGYNVRATKRQIMHRKSAHRLTEILQSLITLEFSLLTFHSKVKFRDFHLQHI